METSVVPPDREPTMAVKNTAVEDFPRLADPYRRELFAHCYRMLGSVHDAEDQVQETYLRAWRAYDSFEGRSSMRTWLHRIATNTCLDALESRGRRPLPTGLGAPSANPLEELVERAEVPWLEPVADDMVGAVEDADPAAVVASRESVRLAFVAALQHLPPRQRAVLLLRDVLKWRAAEVAELLETSVASVNSALQRARAQLARLAPNEGSVREPVTPTQRRLLDRYMAAFEAKDVQAIVALFTQDAVWEMPPFAGWFQGPQDIGMLVTTHCPGDPGGMRLIPAALNGQPSFAMYLRTAPGQEFVPFQLHVLQLEGDAVGHVSAFLDVSLFPRFGLPAALPADTPQRA
jgi:RNA polymerase sigma-70 factor, ECF subfamily